MGNAFQPFIGAVILTTYGWNVLFFVYGGMYLIAASMWLMINPKRTFYERNGGPRGEPAGFEVIAVKPLDA